MKGGEENKSNDDVCWVEKGTNRELGLGSSEGSEGAGRQTHGAGDRLLAEDGRLRGVRWGSG